MKNKIIGILIVLIVLSIYPTWRYFHHANIFVNNIFDQAAGLGTWSHGSASTSFDGKIRIRNLSYQPKNYTQGFEIDSMEISVDPMFLLKSSSEEMQQLLPETLSISINGIVMNNKSNDINQSLKKDSMWMLLAGYAGSFGCSRGSYTSFDDESWSKILSPDQVFNVDLYYTRNAEGILDVDLILDAENLFSSTWSSSLKPSYVDKQIFVDELIVDKLYYNYLDNGFNLARNNACKQNYNGSFATYRLSSAEHVQKYLRTYFTKELPVVLINWYQRMLIPDVEFNAIISLNERKFISDVYRMNQRDLLENSQIEVASAQNEYLPVSLQSIDFTNIDSALLVEENKKREQELKKAKKENLNKQRNTHKARIFRTGKASFTRNININNLSSAINKKIRIKTKKGRPITGILRAVTADKISIESKYKTGTAKLSISKSKIKSAQLVR